jgi:hypothetical protein
MAKIIYTVAGEGFGQAQAVEVLYRHVTND